MHFIDEMQDAAPSTLTVAAEEEIIPTFSDYDSNKDADYDPAAEKLDNSVACWEVGEHNE